MNVVRFGQNTSHLIVAYVSSAYLNARNRESFADLRSFCMFLGHPHGGQNLIGALLDANPNAIISQGQDSLRYVRAGFGRQRIFSLLLRSSRKLASAPRAHMAHHYTIPGQWQGRFERLLAIGDRHAERSTIQLGKSPSLLDRVRHTFDLNLRVAHVYRNPFDQVASMALRRDRRRPDVREAIKHFEVLCQAVQQTRSQLNADELFELRYEDFVESPGLRLRQLCAFLDVAAPLDYVHACSSTVFPSRTARRHRVPWNVPLIDRLHGSIDQFDFLQGYAFDD